MPTELKKKKTQRCLNCVVYHYNIILYYKYDSREANNIKKKLKKTFSFRVLSKFLYVHCTGFIRFLYYLFTIRTKSKC